MTADPTAESASLADTKIIDALITRITDPLPDGDWKNSVIKDFAKKKGLMWRDAINTYGKD